MSVYVQDADFTLLCCDVLEGLASLPDESVHCVVTSPPYWGLRDYSTPGQLGLEPTPDEYVARMVEVFREVRRVLRSDGTCWINLGDSYASTAPGTRNAPQPKGSPTRPEEWANWRPETPPGLKPKDLVGIPWRLAFALQADGWYLRSDIIWSKPNPMPESVTDRPTRAHEYVFLLTRSPRYFFDQEAVREPHALFLSTTGKPVPRMRYPNGKMPSETRGDQGDKGTAILASGQRKDGYVLRGEHNQAGRNVRSVWEIPTQPYPEAHFATYPEELVRRCILAGTSERGCCSKCRQPWEREVERDRRHANGDEPTPTWANDGERRMTATGRGNDITTTTTTLGWHPGCDHDHAPIPCTVLDPFLGSGTTAFVARKHGRRSIGIELNPAYAELAARRLQQQSLFA
jgi:DNA modification methylase